MLVYTCHTCSKTYPASCLDGKADYLIEQGNQIRRVRIVSDNQECEECIKKLRADDDKKREEIRQNTQL